MTVKEAKRVISESEYTVNSGNTEQFKQALDVLINSAKEAKTEFLSREK